MLVFNSKAPRNLILRWMGLYIIDDEVASKNFKFKNLDGFMNGSTINGHSVKPYYNPKHSHMMLPEILSITIMAIDVK